MIGSTAKRLVITLVITMLAATSAFAEHIFGPDELDTSFGAVFRLRQELWENVFDMDATKAPNRNFFRLKTSVFVKLDYDKKYDFLVKLTNEGKFYNNVSSFRPNPRSNSRLDEDELVFDNLYVSMYNVLGLPVDLRIGRQDFLFTHGDGFLILDGTPGDGSRTVYFNAVKANIKFGKDHNLDVIGLRNQAVDEYLPSLHQPIKKGLNTSDEHGFILYSRNKLTENITVEPYYIYKREDAFNATPRLDINALGARAVLKFDNLTVKGEYAHQFGEYTTGRSRRADGGHASVGYKFTSAPLKPELEAGFVYLSGDDPATADKHEGWNPLFSRWPMWSELYVLSLAPENGRDSRFPAYWTNMQIYRASAKVHFSANTNLQVWYNYLRANERTQGLNSAVFSNKGKERGHLPQIQLNHAFSKKVDGHILLEYLDAGNFYSSDAKNALFFRWQVQVKI